MARYSEGFRERALQMLMAPQSMTVAQVSRATGVTEQSLYNWRNRARGRGVAVAADAKNPERWSGENKLAVVIETAALNEAELSAYCRRKGLYVEQVARWREAAAAGVGSTPALSAAERRELLQERGKSRALERELRRKEKALAEAAALLVLQKKARAIWGDDGDA